MKTQEEIAKDSSTKTLEGNSNHSPCNIYAGKVEVLHQSYKSNGLLKVRLGLHGKSTPGTDSGVSHDFLGNSVGIDSL